MNFTRETDNFDLKIQTKRSIQIVENPLNKRETDIFNNKKTINPRTRTVTRTQKLRLVEEMQNSIEEKLRIFSPYHNGRKNPNFVPLHNKFVTIVGDREKFDPLFNYEFQKKVMHEKKQKEQKEEDEEKEKKEAPMEEDMNNKDEREKEILNFKILKKRQKQNIRKTPNSYYTQVMSKNGFSNSYSEKKSKQSKRAINENRVSERIKTLSQNSKEDFYSRRGNANKEINKNRIRDFMILDVNDAKINHLRKQEEEKKEAYFGRRTIAPDEHVKNKRTYVEEFSAKNNQIQEAKISQIVKERQDLQGLVSNRTIDIKNKNEKNKLILQNENEFTPLENFFTKDYYRERAYFKALNYENIRKSLKTYENSRKEVRDYHKMNDKLVQDFIYADHSNEKNFCV